MELTQTGVSVLWHAALIVRGISFDTSAQLIILGWKMTIDLIAHKPSKYYASCLFMSWLLQDHRRQALETRGMQLTKKGTKEKSKMEKSALGLEVSEKRCST